MKRLLILTLLLSALIISGCNENNNYEQWCSPYSSNNEVYCSEIIDCNGEILFLMCNNGSSYINENKTSEIVEILQKTHKGCNVTFIRLDNIDMGGKGK